MGISFSTRIAFIITLSLLLPTFGCGDDGDDTEPGENQTYVRPQESRAIISDDQLRQLEDAGATIYGGDSPPDIAGTYYFGDAEVVFTDSELWPPSMGSSCDIVQTYVQGDSPEEYIASATSPDCELTGDGTSNLISGADGCFTLYSAESGEFEGCYRERVEILSACLNDAGDFVEPVTGSIIPVVEESEECAAVVSSGRQRAQGELAIVSQVSGVAEKQ